MGVVYKALQPSVNRHVAVKVLDRQLAGDPEFVQRFRREVSILALLKHPGVLSIIDFGEADGYTYLVMPLLDGGTLAERLGGEPLPLPEVLRIVGQIAEAIHYAHGKGVVHRDIKPRNILLDESGNCLVSDFGIARMNDATSHLTITGTQIGTPAYMSPEQAEGEPGGTASDIYSLGIVLYELLTGRVPFTGNTPVAVAVKHLTASVPPPTSLNPSLDLALEKVVLKALARAPGDRYATVRDFTTALSLATAAPAAPPARSEPAATPAPPGDATVLRRRSNRDPTPPPMSDDSTVVRSVASAPVSDPTRLETSAERRPRRYPLGMVGTLAVAVAIIGGVLALMSDRPASPIGPEIARPANDLKILIERGIAPHFVEEVRQNLVRRYGSIALETGLQVTTTLDPGLQEAANAAVARGLLGLGDLEAALVAIDHRSGHIRAFVGGARSDGVNRAIRPRRMGSVFMPIVFTAAIGLGFTPYSIVVDEPAEYDLGTNHAPYSPKNDDGLYMGELTVRQALEASRNVAAVKLAMEAGMPRVIETAQKLGLYGDYPFVSLGAGEMDSTLVDVAAAYATIANQGVRLDPRIIVSVTEVDGTQLEEPPIAPREAVNADTAFIITNLLSGVIERGTGTAARISDWPLAGKTGTVAGDTDTWFVGFDPEITVGVWVGHDDIRPIGSQAGASTALAIWTDFMRAYISARGNTGNRPRFNIPANIVFVKLNSGATEAFIAGTEPRTTSTP